LEVMMHTRSIPLAALMAALAVAGCGSDNSSNKTVSPGGSGAEAGAGSTKALVVKETDFKLDPKNLTVKDAGTITITVKNDGQTAHALEVEGQGTEKKTGDIAPGDSATLTVTLKKGSYEWYCPIDGHKQLGMKGTIKVGGGSTNPPTLTTGAGGGSSGPGGSATATTKTDEGY
jgi:uncharacterized cupredoxin-like copper-binding protein